MRQTLFTLVLMILIIITTTAMLIIAQVRIFLMEIQDLVIPEAAMEAAEVVTKGIISLIHNYSLGIQHTSYKHLPEQSMSEDRVKHIRDQCQTTNTSFFFKQRGGVRKHQTGRLFKERT
jgi:uncharacterized membrane protein